MKYHMESVTTMAEDERFILNSAASPSVELFTSLPNGTSIFLIKIYAFGTGIQGTGLIMSDENRDGCLKWAAETGQTELDYAFMIYSLPADIEMPEDPAAAFNEPVAKLGLRHGREGTPMFSESLLKEKYESIWNDKTYTAYANAYKVGTQYRKGN